MGKLHSINMLGSAISVSSAPLRCLSALFLTTGEPTAPESQGSPLKAWVPAGYESTMPDTMRAAGCDPSVPRKCGGG